MFHSTPRPKRDPSANHGLRHGRHCFFPAYHPMVQNLLQLEQFLHVAINETRYWNTSPAAEDCCNILFAGFLLKELVGLGSNRFGLGFGQFVRWHAWAQ